MIIDLYDDLPEKMAQLIISSWDTYRVVHLKKSYDLHRSVDKIVLKCGYYKVFMPDEKFQLEGEIPSKITADWIIQTNPKQEGDGGKIFALNLLEENIPRVPGVIRQFYERLNVRIIDYPPHAEVEDSIQNKAEVVAAGNEMTFLVERVLDISGKHFSTNMEIPVIQSEKSDFDLIILADFFMNIDGRDYIIDVNGLSSELVSLIKEQQFLYLPLYDTNDTLQIVKNLFEFVGIQYDPGPHRFRVVERDDSHNISFVIPGIIFRDGNGESIFFSGILLPEEISEFLAHQGYRVVLLQYER